MPTYTVTDPQTGKKVKLTGDTPPTEQELTQVFAQLGGSPAPERRSGLATIGEMVGDVGVGVAKGAANTAIGLGELVHRIPGVSTAVDAAYGMPGLSEQAFPTVRHDVQPTNTAQKVGFYGEQIGESFLPVGAVGKLRTAAEIGKAGLLTGAQGGTGTDAAISAGLSAVIPGAGAVRRGAKAISESAEPLVRAAVKPTVTALKRIAGASREGLDAKANALVRFIIDRKLTTADKARTLFQETEHELQRVLSVRNAPTDEPTRALRYLDAIERSAAKQRLPASDVVAIRNAAAELVEGSLGEDVVRMVQQPHPTLVDPSGRPFMVSVPETTRAMRATTQADDALSAARSSSRWQTRKSWGEQKGTDKEIRKAVERAGRDAVKVAVPEAKALLQTEGKAIQATEVLDRMAQRAGNRDAVSLPAQVIAAGEIARGGVPLLAFASNWLRNNQLKAGIWADTLGKAIDKGNAPLVADILKKLGVGSASQAMRTSTAQ